MISEGNIKTIFCYIVLQLHLDQLPAPPINSDIFLLTSSTGSFLLDVYNTQPNNTNVVSSIHSFVVRIESDNVTKYWWMVSSFVASFVKTFESNGCVTLASVYQLYSFCPAL